jgi:hypothetical protein
MTKLPSGAAPLGLVEFHLGHRASLRWGNLKNSWKRHRNTENSIEIFKVMLVKADVTNIASQGEVDLSLD